MGRNERRGDAHNEGVVGRTFMQTIAAGSANRLVLNRAFFTATGDILNRKIRVALMNGASYNVSVSSRGGYFTLASGWGDIRTDHGISPGDVALFTYQSPSSLGLRLYGSGGLEKESTVDSYIDESDNEVKEFYCSRNVKITDELEVVIDFIGHNNLPSYICHLSAASIRTVLQQGIHIHLHPSERHQNILCKRRVLCCP